MIRRLVFLIPLFAAIPAFAQTAPAPQPAQPPKVAPNTYKATQANVPYGKHERQVLDFYQAKSDSPTPVIFAIHGGGWVNGSKDNYSKLAEAVNKLGISVVAINYRYTTQAQEAKVEPPVKWPLEDAARALQFTRSKAKEWNLDPKKIGATGGSAGACSSLWLAFHDDMADPKSSDPISHESTRLQFAAVDGAQTTLDPKITREWIPNAKYGGHAFGFRTAENRDSEFQRFYDAREKVLPWIKEYSPMSHVSSDDPPIFLNYAGQKKPPVKGEAQDDPTHSALLGLMLMEELNKAKVDAVISYPQKPAKYKTCQEYLVEKLKAK